MARPDLAMESQRRDLTLLESWSLERSNLHGYLGGGEAGSSGGRDVGLALLSCGEVLGSAGAGEADRGEDLEGNEDLPVLPQVVEGVPCTEVGLVRLDLGGVGLGVGAGLGRQGAGWGAPRCAHNHTHPPGLGREM